jgi:hypothetical protein
MTMDLGQLTQMTTWLDEEHRRDKAELIRLQQQIERQETELQDQSHVIRSLEERVTGLRNQLLKYAQLETSLDQLKEEVVQMFAKADERRQQESREVARVRAVENDNLSRSLNEIRRELEQLPRQAEEMALRKAEQKRVSDILLVVQQDVNALSQEVENRLRGLTFLEDGRQQDAKRIAQLQQETLEALKRLEQQGSRIQRLEDISQRQERDTGELKQLISQLRTSQREFVEAQLLEAESVKRSLSEWIEVMEAHVKKVDQFTLQIQEFAETFREDRQVVESIERFQEAIKREQTQVSELQRLAEERQKRQMEQWSEDNEKRWKKELLHWEHQWSEQEKRNQSVLNRFATIEERQVETRTWVDAAWKFVEAMVTYESQEARRWMGEMTRLLEEKPKKEK